MAGSQGISKLLVAKKETAWGSKAGATGARYYRSVTSSFQLEKDTYNSNERQPSQQMRDMRHGTRRSTGTISGELAGGSYDTFIQSALRRDFTAGVTTGAIITLSSTATTIARSAGSFVTDGFQVGTVINVTGFTDAGNNGLFLITAMSATVLTVSALAGQTRTVEAAGDTVTVLQKGKVTWAPLTGHTDDSYTVEEWNPDTTISRVFLGQQVNTLTLGIQPNSMATIELGFLGKDAEPPKNTAYFTTPTAVSQSSVYSAPDGFLFVNGVANGVVTGLNLTIENNVTQVPVIGSNSIGGKSRGKVMVSLDGSAIFDNNNILGYFDAETEVSLTYVLMSLDNTDAFSIHLPRVKIGSATVSDGEETLILSFSGVALEYVGVAAGVKGTTIQIQDTSL